MTIPGNKKLFIRMNEILSEASYSNWEGISEVLAYIKDSIPLPTLTNHEKFIRQIKKGIAFITFDYGIDGVSIEIAKYAKALESSLQESDEVPIHLVGGDFYPQADSVLMDHWHRLKIEGTNGWSKWDSGKWFSSLFYEDLPEGSRKSDELAQEIFKQASSIADRLGRYLAENDISLIIPVNIASNPGNLALTLALVLVTEAMGLYVINSNHDFYWEGGQKPSEKEPRDRQDLRDHFYRNVNNRPFFKLFKSLYPWNGRRWLQVNINNHQSHSLINEYAFSETSVFVLSTSVNDNFFDSYSKADIKHARLRMAYILGDGQPIVEPLPVDSHLDGLADWIEEQSPRVIGARSGLKLDLTSENIIYLLQPTRVIARKQIDRNLLLINELLARQYFKEEFEQNEKLRLILHITGPTPIEHQNDHEIILRAFIKVIDSVPAHISDRIFIAFSAGRERHSSFDCQNYQRLRIEDIYRMASVVVFPSEREGRGLPIIEASACGIPIICSRFSPDEVFSEVIGEHLPEKLRIKFVHFPNGSLHESFLRQVSRLFLHPETFKEQVLHNKHAVRSRFGFGALEEAFSNLLETLRKIA